MSEQEHRQWTPYKIVLVYPRPFLEGTNLRPYFERFGGGSSKLNPIEIH